MYGDIMEKSVVRQNLKSRNYFKNTLDKLKNLNKTKIKLNILLVIVGILFLIALLALLNRTKIINTKNVKGIIDKILQLE